MRPVGSPPALDDLRELPLLGDLPDEVLEWLALEGEHLAFEADEVFAQVGDPAEHMFILLDGEARTLVPEGNHVSLWSTFVRGSITGVLPYSRMTHYAGVVVGVVPGRMLRVHRSLFPEMLRRSPVLGERLVGLLSDRVRDTTRTEQQRDRMIALGRLSAGLAHELNNPAASVGRNAAELAERLARMPELVVALSGCGAGPEVLEAVEALRDEVAVRPPGPPLSPLRRSEQEDGITDWLSSRQVSQPWLLAASFVDGGFTPDDLDRLARSVPPPALPAVVQWLECGVASQRLLGEIALGASRISDLVGSVKSYSHMDRGVEPEPVDIRQGLEQTLVMMGHAIREKKIGVEREYDEHFPRILGFPGELNQVWTNLVHNAIDAMSPGGTLTLRACSLEGRVVVEVEDTGAGIPPEVLPRIFEPFFTTKPMGEGTGMGLDIVQRIVRRQHRGDVRVESEPGRTVVSVVLPGEGPAPASPMGSR